MVRVALACAAAGVVIAFALLALSVCCFDIIPSGRTRRTVADDPVPERRRRSGQTGALGVPHTSRRLRQRDSLRGGWNAGLGRIPPYPEASITLKA
jgi:hypothetical protein